jgi:hypothetical protein
MAEWAERGFLLNMVVLVVRVYPLSMVEQAVQVL